MMCTCGNKKIWEISVASFQHCCEAKTALENKVFKKKVSVSTQGAIIYKFNMKTETLKFISLTPPHNRFQKFMSLKCQRKYHVQLKLGVFV